MRVPASATDCPLPKLGIVTIGHGRLLALTILIGPDCSTTICLPSSLPRTPQQPVSSSAQTMSGMSAWVTSDTTRWRRAANATIPEDRQNHDNRHTVPLRTHPPPLVHRQAVEWHRAFRQPRPICSQQRAPRRWLIGPPEGRTHCRIAIISDHPPLDLSRLKRGQPHRNFAVLKCKSNIEMTPLCKVEVTLAR